MAVEWTEPPMVWYLQAMTHQRHFEKIQVDSFSLLKENVQICDNTVIYKRCCRCTVYHPNP